MVKVFGWRYQLPLWAMEMLPKVRRQQLILDENELSVKI